MIDILIKKLRERYIVEYDVKEKILWIKESIPVEELLGIKRYLIFYNIKIRELKVGRFI